VHYLRTGGANPPVVLLHGLTCSGATWLPIARVLERNFDVVMPDARGHGGSSAPLHGYTYADHATDVIGLIDALELERPIVVGHSMGGMVAAVVATRARLRGVVLVDPTFLSAERQREVRDSDVAEQHRRVLGLARADLVAELRTRHPQRASELIELLADARQRTSLAAFDVLTPPNPDYREVVRAIEAPSVLVIADRGVVTREQAAELGMRVELITDAGHGVPFDQPGRLADVVAGMLR
jgi:pimeloyl-ACP methyl ester carboxylesterase